MMALALTKGVEASMRSPHAIRQLPRFLAFSWNM